MLSQMHIHIQTIDGHMLKIDFLNAIIADKSYKSIMRKLFFEEKKT